MRVLLVTSWDQACGIAEHSAMLKASVEAADSTITILPDRAALDPLALKVTERIDVLHLNYQASLLSRWTPEHIGLVRTMGTKVLVTYHDTGVPNSDQCKAVIEAADAAVVHEPFDDLPAEKVRYWRQGVPDWPLVQFVKRKDAAHAWQPLLGTIGFPFGWKCHDELAKLTGEIGWALLLIAPSASPEQQATWRRLNPDVLVRADFVDRDRALALLAGCDATAFTYVCHNTGTSGAIRLGLAARKPLLALSTCRQFRDLHAEAAITWCHDFVEVRARLRTLPIVRVDPGIVELAHRDSWSSLGRKYAALYQELAR